MAIEINPSILSSDFSDLRGELDKISTADMAHIDVMDNHFVPNLTFGPPVVERLQAISPIPLDAHLMIAEADRHAPVYAELGCASVTFHAEAAAAPVRLAREIRKLGAKASLALKPATPIEPFVDLLGEFDQILIMTVEPGFGGQTFLDVCLPKIRRTREAISAAGLEIKLQVDGGVSTSTIERVVDAGADVLVAGSAVYGAEDAATAISGLRELAASHVH
ncbi:MAG: ribulose-phosphate 3-epimerase [Brevibacterium sp.]|nr:ribulose-phosphate 3-epimerase [Brevibacterium sp.]MDN5832419.1 ribulose-phosphate 3-epimerase [Brevibacterium sp.]MDN5875096.1 ribulose-phosphate 3-epimerase [Brevibacterium sp.]MDN6122917.1 ribulose-phosphate 3-epimerase [Brevibacterium sp.]MDN6157701.1 ribulose-phosphate 3-epimerase [Brevibacterium sp.]